MNRMTVKRNDGRWAIANNDGSTVARQFEKLPVAIDRLAAYEDTGLEPEEIVDLQRAWDMYGGEDGINQMIAELQRKDSPNAPLTLEELREMDGEPVWFCCDFTKTHIWRIISFVSQLMVYFTDGGSVIIKDYGNTWLAYRNKPENT